MVIITCRDCGERKPLMGRGWCARCYMRQYQRWKRATDLDYRERQNQISRAYQQRRTLKSMRESSRLYRQRHPDRARAGWDRWEERNSDKHKESNRASAERARRRNPEKKRASTRAWFAKNKAYRVMKENERRARKLGVGGQVSREEWATIKRAQRYRCHYCRKRKRLTQDHVVPLSKGGRHVASNIVGACRSCNSRKKDRPAEVMFE